MLASSRARLFRAAGATALLAAAMLPLTVPTPAQAWWRSGFGVGVYLPVPAIVVAPPIYAPPPVVYAPPVVAYAAPPLVVAPVWIAPHWYNGYWVRGYWRR